MACNKSKPTKSIRSIAQAHFASINSTDSPVNTDTLSKLDFDGIRVDIPAADAERLITEIFSALGCPESNAKQVARHLVDTSLCGIESHGVMRTLQYAEQMQSGYLNANATPAIVDMPGGGSIDGCGAIGIPAMHMAYELGMKHASKQGISAVSVRNTGHTGRLGAFADDAAQKGFMTICIGGGNRRNWRQVAPFGGTQGILPTNPWCIGMPGGDRGSVVVDIATSKIAGGWIYAARSADARLPAGCVIDADGNPTTDPEDYFNGGAILPFGEHKGFGLALVAELVAEALLGETMTECNWLIISLDTSRYSNSGNYPVAAEVLLAELRNCPTAADVERVEIPGERERECRHRSGGVLAIPQPTWQQISALHRNICCASSA